MCFGTKPQKAEAPPPPAETLTQVAPDKKTDTPVQDGGEKSSTISTPTDSTNPLTIGTKKYRSNGAGSSLAGSPSGIDLTK